MAGLDIPSSGQLDMNGHKITGPNAERTVMFQEPSLYPWLNVINNVKIGMKFIGLSEQEQEERASTFYLRFSPCK